MDGYSVCFVDKSRELIRALRREGAFSIAIGKKRELFRIDEYQTFLPSDEGALLTAADAPYIFISVGVKNLPELKDFLVAVCELRDPSSLRVVVCENGVDPASALRNVLLGTVAQRISISQCAIFCTTVTDGTQLGILSEDYSHVPYDADAGAFPIECAGFEPVQKFVDLMRRKIYTYNCLSACIAYLGYERGYVCYADAANDAELKPIYEEMTDALDAALSLELNIPTDEQKAFSRRAMDKFSNPDIADTIWKNARDARRKISPGERLMGPMAIFLSQKRDIDILCRVIACAIDYMEREEETPQGEGIDLFLQMNGMSRDSQIALLVKRHYEELTGRSCK
ncbi:MAG: mannitol-1-phosphate 5-dehydrogenase [Clostridia bacterium]|nr:mannitol-1-phosphate 5-dehydrogenase [Clostridia bacterium]